MTKKSPLSVSFATTSNLRFFSKYLVPAIVFLLDRDLRCSSKLLIPLTQSAYQSPKLHSPPQLLPLASSPALHLIPSSRCRHQLLLRCLLSTACCQPGWVWTSPRTFYTCRNTSIGPTAPHFCSILMYGFTSKGSPWLCHPF